MNFNQFSNLSNCCITQDTKNVLNESNTDGVYQMVTDMLSGKSIPYPGGTIVTGNLEADGGFTITCYDEAKQISLLTCYGALTKEAADRQLDAYCKQNNAKDLTFKAPSIPFVIEYVSIPSLMKLDTIHFCAPNTTVLAAVMFEMLLAIKRDGNQSAE